jgi:hypothetical protein
MDDELSTPTGAAARAMVQCARHTALLVLRRRLRQPRGAVGRVLTFADGSSAAVYRETVAAVDHVTEPVVLVVAFRLRRVRSERVHALFRLESLANTPLFAGFPGFVSKLWLRHDQRGRYRGVYQWDGAARAEAYVGALRHVLALVSEPGSIQRAVLPGLLRDAVLADPSLAADLDPRDATAWWRPVEATLPVP